MFVEFGIGSILALHASSWWGTPVLIFRWFGLGLYHDRCNIITYRLFFGFMVCGREVFFVCALGLLRLYFS